MQSINIQLKKIINEKGLKFTKVAEATEIDYQRLNRLFNQDALMSASELIILCDFLDIDPNIFKKSA